jgi:transposase
MSKTRNHYTREFKVEALRLAETNGKPFAEVEREMGLSHGDAMARSLA